MLSRGRPIVTQSGIPVTDSSSFTQLSMSTSGWWGRSSSSRLLFASRAENNNTAMTALVGSSFCPDTCAGSSSGEEAQRGVKLSLGHILTIQLTRKGSRFVCLVTGVTACLWSHVRPCACVSAEMECWMLSMGTTQTISDMRTWSITHWRWNKDQSQIAILSKHRKL